MSNIQARSETAIESSSPRPVDMKLEVVVIAVSDVDRAKRFYADLGFRLDADFVRADGSRAVQFTPTGSPGSIQLGTAPLLYLVVSDIEAARAGLIDRGVEVSEVFHRGTGLEGRLSGPDPERRSYASLATFRDPDGNAWLIQEVTRRLPGRVDADTTFASSSELASALRRAAAAHGEHEKRIGQHDANFLDWYADYIVREQTGKELPSEVINQGRRQLLSTAAMAIPAAAAASLFPAYPAPAAASDAIRPFRIDIPEQALVDLRRRLAATRWPEKETVADDSQGVPLATLQLLVQHWQTDYDWRKVEARLNAWPQFITEIDGLDIHFIHVRSKHENALPLIVTHGWPGSVIEQLKIIDPLTNPTAHGGSASDAFHLVIPSMPGYGFSGKPTATGWDPTRIARAWIVLMKRLGYTRFVAQGGDWGSPVSNEMAKLAPPELLGIHVNLPGVVPPEIIRALQSGDPAPTRLSDDEKHAFEQLKLSFSKRRAYAQIMGTRPQTLSGLADSPAGLAAWLLDHGDGDAQPAAAVTSAVLGRTIDGHSAGDLTRDDVLDNITLYWLTNTAISAARLYWENKINLYLPANVSIPAAVTVFPGESFQAPRSWTERAYHKLIYFHRADKGGHFAAWEQPELFSAEIRAAFRSLRPSI